MHGILNTFQNELADCNQLITEAFARDFADSYIISERGRYKIAEAAFLNAYIAWESFLEACFEYYLMGGATTSGVSPVTLYKPADATQAQSMMAMLGNGRFFDYTAPDLVIKAAELLFVKGYPIADAVRSSLQSLQDLKTMRNAAAHMSLQARRSFDALVQRKLIVPHTGLSLGSFLMKRAPELKGFDDDRVFAYYRAVLSAAAKVIADGSSLT